jgi:RNA polymerase sigma-32 factor
MGRLDHGSQQLDRQIVSRAMRAPILTQVREYQLIEAWQREHDRAALQELTDAYMRLVISQSSRFRNYGVPMPDLVQEGILGLLQAAERFDTAREVRFATYATWWIRSAMQEYILRNWSIVRSGSSASQKALFFKLRWLRARIEAKRELPPGEVAGAIATALKVSNREVEAMMSRLSAHDQSLDVPLSEEGDGTAADFLPDDGPTPEEIVLAQDDATKRGGWLRAALAELSPRELLIVENRRLREDAATLEEIGGQLGVTKERVRQIEQKAVGKLRDAVLRHARTDGAALPC